MNVITCTRRVRVYISIVSKEVSKNWGKNALYILKHEYSRLKIIDLMYFSRYLIDGKEGLCGPEKMNVYKSLRLSFVLVVHCQVLFSNNFPKQCCSNLYMGNMRVLYSERRVRLGE